MDRNFSDVIAWHLLQENDMLTFLFLLCVLWVGYWSYALWRDRDKPSPVYISSHQCADCARGNVDNQRRSERGSESLDSETALNPSITSVPKPSNASNPTPSIASKPNPGSSTPGSTASNNKKSAVVPLFTAPTEEVDDLKKIKGVGVVMERTLNDLGITTFKQLAEFQDAEVQMVTDALSESSAGFGDRITRDEWVSQAKEFAATKQG